MRKVLLMVFAVGMFMALGTAGASASSGSGSSSDAKHCNYSSKGKGKGKGECKPTPCKAGETRNAKGECKPTPCKAGEVRNAKGECKPKPVECKGNEIKTDKGCVPRPKDGPCSKADLVLLEDLLKGTGGLLCVYLGNNAPNADEKKNCAGAALALPIDHLLGACLFLPPVDIKDEGGSTGTTPTTPSTPAAPSLTDLPSSLTAVLNVVLKLKLK